MDLFNKANSKFYICSCFVFFHYVTKILRKRDKPETLEKRKYAEYVNFQAWITKTTRLFRNQ
jgi:hypothetical protein